MKVSTKSRYGVAAMVDIAQHFGKGPVALRSVAERQQVSEHYLEQLMSNLRNAGFVRSIRGAQGGYVLNREPKDITTAEIMEVLEGPVEISDCLDENTCSNIDCCATRGLWARIKESIDSVLESTTLQDLVDDYISLKK